MSVENQIRDFILKNYLFTDDRQALQNDASFMEQGIIDSTGIMEVIAFLQEEFGIAVEDEELTPENLDSIDNLVAFIARKQAAER